MSVIFVMHSVGVPTEIADPAADKHTSGTRVQITVIGVRDPRVDA